MHKPTMVRFAVLGLLVGSGGCLEPASVSQPMAAQIPAAKTMLSELAKPAPILLNADTLALNDALLPTTPPPREANPFLSPELARGNLRNPVVRAAAPSDEETSSRPPFPRRGAMVGVDPTLARLYRRASERLQQIDCLETRVRWRESTETRTGTWETVQMRCRTHPYSVHLKWLDGDAAGRELLYVQGEFGDDLHILTAKGELLPGSAPTRLHLSPDSPMIRSRCRYSIREVGLCRIVDRLGQALQRPQTVRSLGLQTRPEFDHPLQAVTQTLAPGEERAFPQGGTRTLYFDPSTHRPSADLPVLLIGTDPQGRELEYYCFQQVQVRAPGDYRPFHPQILGKP